MLGNTYGMLVLQDFEALTPNLLARTVETVEGGGVVVLLLSSLDSLTQARAGDKGVGRGGVVAGGGGAGARGGARRCCCLVHLPCCSPRHKTMPLLLSPPHNNALLLSPPLAPSTALLTDHGCAHTPTHGEPPAGHGCVAGVQPEWACGSTHASLGGPLLSHYSRPSPSLPPPPLQGASTSAWC